MKLFFKLIFFSLFLFGSVHAQFLHVEGQNVVDANGETVILRGMGLGGWMLQEGYMLQLASVANPQHEIKALLEETIGVENTNTFYDAWLKNHTTKRDVDSLAAWGFNSIRLPMHYNLYTLSIQEEPLTGENTWLDKGFAMTDSLLNWCAENEIYLILDLHAAPGGQGHDAAISDWNSDYPSLWESIENKKKTIALWRKLAERYRDHPWIGGYDLINEPNWGFENPDDLHGVGEQGNVPLRELLVNITNAIREVDTNHIIYIEGNSWANNYNGIFPPWDDNMVASFHKYWTVNDTESIQWMLEYRNEYNIPLWLGESGENSNTWYKDAISVCEQNNIGWAWWPLKKVGLNNVLEIKKNQGYQDLINYWEGNGAKPSESVAFSSLMQLTEDIKLENCIFHPDVVDAMIRQPYSNEAMPFKAHVIKDGYKLYMSDFDLGGHEVGYSDNVVANYHVSTGSYTAWNSGWLYRNDGVDIDVCEDDQTNGFAVGWIEPGEWMQYTVDVESSGMYDLNIRAASNVHGNSMKIYINDLPAANAIALPNTGGWQNWETTKASDVYLEQGENIIRVHIAEGEYNLNYIEFTGPRTPDAVQPVFLGAFANDELDSVIQVVYNQPFIQLEDYSSFSAQINGISAEIDTAYAMAGQSNIIAIELAAPLVFGDYVSISYSGTEVQTVGGATLGSFSNLNVELNFQDPSGRNIIPGKIEAENMKINHGFRLEDCLDEGGGLAITHSSLNDYLIYDIDVLQSGTYQITYRHSGLGGTGKIKVYKIVDENEELIESMEFNSTLGWQNWKDKIGIEFDLQEGTTQIKVLVEAGNFNLNYLDFNLVSVPANEDLRFLTGFSNQNGDKLFLEFNKPILESSVSVNGFSLIINGGNASISSVELTGASILEVQLANPLGEDDIIKLAYNTQGGIQSADGKDLLAFENMLIINNTIVLNLLPIPGKIEVEDFTVNSGFEFETCTDTGGGKNAGYTDNGDYLEFDVLVDEDGSYDLYYRVASESAGGSLSLQLVEGNSATTISTVSFDATGGWQTWTTVEDQVTLEKGIHKIRLLAKSSLFNINWIELKKTPDKVLGLLEEMMDFKIFPNPAQGEFSIQIDDMNIDEDDIRLYDLSGKQSDFEISRSSEKEFYVRQKLEAGLYIISVQNENSSIVKKIMIE